MAKKRGARRPKPQPDEVFQFKITLPGIRPPVWRRIQVPDGTLDRLHEHIQNAMGWSNSHLHEFQIGPERFGNPDLLDDDFDESDCEDSCRVLLSELLEGHRKGFRFSYVYDFGDNWEHEVLFEGRVPVEAKVKYPRCVGGKRGCPPEDCGGAWGYEELLAALSDRKHEEHEDYKEWAGELDPESFSAEAATRAMRAGLPD